MFVRTFAEGARCSKCGTRSSGSMWRQMKEKGEEDEIKRNYCESCFWAFVGRRIGVRSITVEVE